MSETQSGYDPPDCIFLHFFIHFLHIVLMYLDFMRSASKQPFTLVDYKAQSHTLHNKQASVH